MRRIKLALTIILLLFITLLAAVFIAPTFIDWNKNKGIIENIASDYLGYKVKINGDLEVQLLPNPKVYADSITIDALTGNTKIATIEQVVLNKQLSDLIAFDATIDRVVLNRLKLNLITNESSTNNWEPVKSKTQNFVTKQVYDLIDKISSFKSMSVENSTIEYNNYTTNEKHEISKINIDMQNISNNMSFQGSVSYNGVNQDISLGLNVSNPNITGASFAIQNDRYKITTQGSVENFYNINNAVFKGSIDAEFGDANTIKTFKILDIIKKEYFDLKELKIAGNLTASKNIISLENMSLTSKYNTLKGHVIYKDEENVQEVDVNLDIEKAYIKKDDILNKNENKSSKYIEWSDKAIDLSFIDNLKLSLDLKCLECIYGNNIFYDVNIKSSLENNNIIINQFNLRTTESNYLKFKANGSLSSPVAFDANFETKDFPIETILSVELLDKFKFDLNGNASVSSSGVSEKDIFANMSGNFDFDIKNLELNKIDDSDIRRTLSGLFLDRNRVDFNSKIKDFIIAGTVRDGVIRNTDIPFELSGEEMIAKGKFDLANLTANYRFEPVKLSKNNLGAVISGNINNLELIADKVTPKGVIDGFNRIVTTEIVKKSKKKEVKTPFNFDDKANLEKNVKDYLFSN